MSNIKDYFVSRYPNGWLMELDYSQLEIIALAILSDDKQLKQDILDGIDLHRVRASEMFNKPEKDVSDSERKIAKAFSFQLQYGASAKSMAAKNGTSVKLAQKFIDVYYTRYPDVRRWQEATAMEVQTSRIPSSRTTDKGYPTGMGYCTSPTGRKYVFFEEDSWRGVSFSPTKMKNYPVQGFATGDIVPIMLGQLFDYVMHTSVECKLINTVHDSVLLDVNTSDNERDLYVLARTAKDILESAPEIFREHFSINMDLPMTVDVEVGKTWGSMKKLDI